MRDVPDRPAYTRLVVSHPDGRSSSSGAEGRVVGAVVLGVPDEAPDLLTAVEQSAPVGQVAALRTGSWQRMPH